MLLSFSLRNFRSFDTEQTLTMVAQRRFSEHEERLIPLPNTDIRLLPAAVFYGANGAGKSNLIRAFEFVRRLVHFGIPPKQAIPLQPFRFGATDREKSRFEIRFFSQGNLFNYGFEATTAEICSEWLDIYTGEKAIPLFERDASNPRQLEFSQRLKNESERIAALETVGVRSNQLFLSAIRESIESEGQGPLMQAVLSWFSDIFVTNPETHYEPLAIWLSRHKNFKDFVDSYMSEAGTGLVGIDPKPILVENRLSETERDRAKTQLHSSKRHGLVRTTFTDGKRSYVDLDEQGRLVTYDLSCIHSLENGKQVGLPISEESDGIQRLSELLVDMHITSEGTVLLIDELDRSLHPLLAKKFIESFLKLRPKSQLIVTTHDTNLLNLDLLRRDEIWFAEKDRHHATHIYPLAEFPIRSDLRVAKGYLQGRFGAVPFMGGIDSLIQRSTQNHSPHGAATPKTESSSSRGT